MIRFILAAVLTVAMASVAAAEHYFANITAVDAGKGTVVYKVTFGKNKNKEFKANVAKDCVIREGFYRLGKPARLQEGEHLVNGLRNFVFEMARADNPLKVNIYTADAADKDKGSREGDIVKILVHPKQ
jgi:hypothetical protein